MSIRLPHRAWCPGSPALLAAAWGLLFVVGAVLAPHAGCPTKRLQPFSPAAAGPPAHRTAPVPAHTPSPGLDPLNAALRSAGQTPAVALWCAPRTALATTEPVATRLGPRLLARDLASGRPDHGVYLGTGRHGGGLHGSSSRSTGLRRVSGSLSAAQAALKTQRTVVLRL